MMFEKYENFKKEIINKAVTLYNLLPEEVKDFVKFGNEISEDLSKIIKVVKFYNEFKERRLVKKIEQFLKNTNTLSLDEVNNLIEKCELTKEKFIEHLIVTIDRLESEEKVNYFSKLFILFATTNMEKQLYFRCCKILDNYSYYDLVNFKEKEEYNFENKDDILYFSIGLLQNISQGKNSGISLKKLAELTLSDAGNVFLELNK